MDQDILKPRGADLYALVKRKANLPSLMLGASGVLAGTGAAAIRGNADVLPATICLLFAAFAQLSANLGHYYMMVNRYYDNMPRPKMKEPQMYGNNIAVRALREASFACLIIATMLGLTIMAMAEQPWWTLILGAIIIGSNLLLTRGKHPMFGSPWSLVFTWLIFGPVAVVGTSYLQVQHGAPTMWGLFDNAPSLYLGAAMGFLAINVHIIYSYSVNILDPGVNPNSIVRHLGKKGVIAMVFINGLIALGIVFFMVFYLVLPRPEIAFVPIFLGFSLNAYIAIRMPRATVGELTHLSMLSKINILLTGLTILVLWSYIGAPDTSQSVFF